MSTTATRLAWLADVLAAIDDGHLRRRRHDVRRHDGGRIERDGRVLLDFASNDYLGLAGDPEVIAAAKSVLSETGVGSGASAMVTGRSPWHGELERTLARFESEEDAVLFPTGYAANVGTITALVGSNDVVYCGRLNHASLVDACRLSGAAFRVFRSDRLDELEKHLASVTGFDRRWIVTDGVFGMDGTVAPLSELCDIAERFEAALIVDEAHGTGVLGHQGRGACERCGVEDRVDVRIGTLSKAVGSLGGFVAGPKVLTEYLWHRAKTQMFSTALPPAVCAAASTAIRLIGERRKDRETLAQTADRFRNRLREAGLTVPGDIGVPIIPVVLETPEAALAAGVELDRRGFAVGVIRPPTVPRGTSRLRISLSSVHEDHQVAALSESLIEVCQ